MQFSPVVIIMAFVLLTLVFALLFILLGDFMSPLIMKTVKKHSVPLGETTFDNKFVKRFLRKPCGEVKGLFIPKELLNSPNNLKKEIAWSDFWEIISYDESNLKRITKEIRGACFLLLVGAVVALLNEAGTETVDLLDLEFYNSTSIKFLGFTDFIVLLMSFSKIINERERIIRMVS